MPDNGLGSILKYQFHDYLGAILLLAYTNILIFFCAAPCGRIQTLSSTLLMGVVCAFAWEGIAPLVLAYSTADWRDCLAYLCGSVSYWILCRAFAKS